MKLVSPSANVSFLKGIPVKRIALIVKKIIKRDFINVAPSRETDSEFENVAYGKREGEEIRVN